MEQGETGWGLAGPEKFFDATVANEADLLGESIIDRFLRLSDAISRLSCLILRESRS